MGLITFICIPSSSRLTAILAVLIISLVAVTIMFEQPTYTGSEGGPPVMICAQITALMGTLDCDLVVTFSAIPDAKTGMTNVLIEKFLLMHNCYEYCVSNIQPGCLHIVDAPLACLQWNQVIFIINFVHTVYIMLMLWNSISCTQIIS